MKLPTFSQLLVLLGISAAAHADLLTSSAGFTSPTVLDFNTFGGMGYNFTFGPVAVGSGVTFTATGPNLSGQGAILGSGSYSLAGNGSWDYGTIPDGAYTAVDGDKTGASMTFTLSTPTSAIGGFMNYADLSPYAVIEVLDSSSVVLESYDLMISAPISTPGGVEAGAFRGISRPGADIYAFRVVGGYAVLDDLTFEAVPEPSAWFAFSALGLGGFVVRRVLRRSRG